MKSSDDIIHANQRPRDWVSRETRDAIVIGLLVGFLTGLIRTLEGHFIFIPFIAVTNDPRIVLFSMAETEEVNNALWIGLIQGCILGFLFSIFKKRIPGKTTIRKALVYALILTLIELAQTLSAMNLPILIAAYGSSYPLVTVVTFVHLIVVNPILGFIFGYTLNRISKSTHNQPTFYSQQLAAFPP